MCVVGYPVSGFLVQRVQSLLKLDMLAYKQQFIRSADRPSRPMLVYKEVSTSGVMLKEKLEKKFRMFMCELCVFYEKHSTNWQID